jgi:hypothetical protein
MDAPVLLHSVMEPGERILWTGQPAGSIRALLAGLPISFVMLIGFGNIFRLVLKMQTQALPVYLQVELFASAVLFLLPMLFCWYRFVQIRKTAYAITNQRLLVAVGAEREKIRTVDIRVLSPVRLSPSRQGGNVLLFSVRGRESVWTLLTSGKADKWRGQTWRVENPESLRQLIESIRTASTVTAA